MYFRSKGKESEYENMDSDLEAAAVAPLVNLANRSTSEQRELDEFEEEERKILSQDSQIPSGLAFAIPGRWTGGKREEDEMRRLMALEAAEAIARGELLEETSASDWSSEDDKEAEKAETEQPPVASVMASTASEVKEPEKLLENPKKKREDTGNEADMDDTSVSSRGSSRMLESINVMSMDSMNVM